MSEKGRSSHEERQAQPRRTAPCRTHAPQCLCPGRSDRSRQNRPKRQYSFHQSQLQRLEANGRITTEHRKAAERLKRDYRASMTNPARLVSQYEANLPRAPKRYQGNADTPLSIAARCELNGERTDDRCVGICYLEGFDVAAEMIAGGVARDCPRFSGGRYAELEAAAARDGSEIRSAYPLPRYCE